MAENFEEMSVAAIMRMTGYDRETALKFYQALEEGQRAFNAAKKLDRKNVTLSRTTLYRLLVASSSLLGMTNGALPPGTPARAPRSQP